MDATCSKEYKSCNSAINFRNLKNNYDLILNNSDEVFEKKSNTETIKQADIKKIQNKIEEYGSKKIIRKLNNFVFSRLYYDGEMIVDNLVYFPLEIKEIRINHKSNSICRITKTLNKKLPPANSIKFKISDEKLLNCFKSTSNMI